MDSNLDYNELHVSVRDAFTQKPYIDSATGLSTLDLPYETCELVDVMYEPRKSTLSTARVVLPSLIRRPELRPLLQQIREGARVEIFDFQPDCGDPLLAGFIPPEGIQQSDGKPELNVTAEPVRGSWQRLRRAEQFNDTPSNLYARALSHWVDLVNEDFSTGTAAASAYGSTPVFTDPSGFGTAVWTTTGYRVTGTTDGGQVTNPLIRAPVAVVPVPGDTYMLEAAVTLFQDWHYTVDGSNNQKSTAAAFGMLFVGPDPGGGLEAHPYVRADIRYAVPAANPPAFLGLANRYLTAVDPSGNVLINQQQQSAFSRQPEPAPQAHRVALLLRFTTGTLTLCFTLDNTIVSQVATPWVYGSTLNPAFVPTVNGNGIYALVRRFRARKLVPYLNRGARFVAQTLDPVYYQPNNEDALSFLNLIAEKDNSEYRIDYRAWPQQDEIALDAVNTLGRDLSATLGYSQPARTPSSAGKAAPVGAIAETAAFGSWAPPMRLEEGWNLIGAPRSNPRANPHANDAFRMGSGTSDAQPFSEEWAVAEVGNPVLGIAPLYPYFESLTNDDRVGLQAVLDQVCVYDLKAKTDNVPSLTVQAVLPLPFGPAIRAGDWSLVRTLSLITNVEQSLRLMQIRRQAGSPVAEVVLGHIDRDPAMLAMLQLDMMTTWLYEQSGSSPTVWVYPFAGAAAAGASLSTQTIMVDKFTSGSAIVGAKVHWVTNDSSAAKWQAVINGAVVTASSPPTANDSGVVDCSAFFLGAGQYSLAFQNTDSVSRTLLAAYLMVQIKI